MKSGMRMCGRAKTRLYCNMIADTASLDRKCAAIDRVVAEKEALVADLAAFKKSLIFETVTGKREVA